VKNYLKVALRLPNDWRPCVLHGHYIGPGQNAIAFFFDGSRAELQDAQHAAQMFADTVARDLPRSAFPALVSTWRSVPGGPPAVGSTHHANISPR
jgi:hypothetical protein